MYCVYVRTHTHIYTHAATSNSVCAWVRACVGACICVSMYACVCVQTDELVLRHNTLRYFSPAPGGAAPMSIHSSSF